MDKTRNNNKEVEDLVALKKVAYSLSINERKILPYVIKHKTVDEIVSEVKITRAAVERALEFLSNKKIIQLTFKKQSSIVHGKNGILYIKNGLPERRLVNVLIEKGKISIDEINFLNKEERNIAIGELKRLKIINLDNKNIILINKENAVKKFPQEKFLESLPRSLSDLNKEEKVLFKHLLKRKDLIRVDTKNIFTYKTSDFAHKILEILNKSKTSIIDKVTPELIKSKSWRGKKFRHYDIKSKVPDVFYGRRHFYLVFLEEARQKLLSFGFKEMDSSIIVNEFWNFDALFQPQHHIAREWSDTYQVHVEDQFSIEIPKKIMFDVKKMHEKKWNYKWDEKKARNFILRPQGTVISALTIAKNSERIGKFLRRSTNRVIFEKYFALARVFRPDVVDSTHLTEFNQCEGIIIGKNLTFPDLLGWLQRLTKEIAGSDEIKFNPDYYPFTEPSVEISVKLNNKWLEVGGAGIFREELLRPILGNHYQKGLKVLAWGLGIDRLAMIKYNINDIRQIFSKDINFLREKKI